MVYSLKNVQDDSMPVSLDAVVMSSRLKSTGDKLSEEVVFDSGIVSEDISQAYSAEVSAEYDTGTNQRTQSSSSSSSPSSSSSLSSSSKHLKEYTYTRSEEFDSKDQMGLSELNITDSGIYTDVSERLYDSAIKDEPTKTVSKTKISEVEERTSPSTDDILRDIFTQDEDGDTQLHVAIIKNDLRFVTEILKIIPSADYINIRNYYSQTSLHLSVLMNLPKVTRLLFLAGARTEIEDRNGNTALHLACETNNLACAMALLNPLTAYEVKYIVFQYKPVIERSNDYLNEYNYDGLSCLHLAAKHKDRQILGQLLMYGADVNISECKAGYTLLHEAVESGDANLVDYILQHPGIDINRKNYARRTAYQLASRHRNIRQLLLESGSQRYASDEDDDLYSDESDDEDTYLVYSDA